MFQHNFESGGGTLISLRSRALALTLFPPVKIFSAKISSHSRRLQNFSQSTRSLRGNFLWIGERPIQRRLFGLIFPLKKLGQKSDASTFSLCEL
jgi:hypothetical protein